MKSLLFILIILALLHTCTHCCPLKPSGLEKPLSEPKKEYTK